MLKNFRFYLNNFFGWSTSKKIIVIESDDWGSTRFKDARTRDYFFNRFPFMQNSWMDEMDCLESDHDLQRLFDVLFKYEDRYSNKACLTAFVNVCNPLYERIEEEYFNNYYYETFGETAKRYNNHSNIVNLHLKGLKNKIFVPEYHGREHLRIVPWLNKLRCNEEAVKLGFEQQYFSFDKRFKNIDCDFRAAYDYANTYELKLQKRIIKSGLEIFKNIYGRDANVMVPPNGPFSVALETILYKNNVSYIGTAKKQLVPLGNMDYKSHYNYLGKKRKSKLINLTRNIIFEPAKGNRDWVDSALAQISKAFFIKKPAVITSHRSNYISQLNEKRGNLGLRELDRLLNTILKIWPNVEFMSSNQLGNHILNKKMIND